MISTLLAAAVSISGNHTFDVRGGQFLLDGKPFQILAAELHYARIPRQLWRQRIRMAKGMGMNTISTYIFWNVHEPKKGKFNFSGDADVAKFIRLCAEEGMWVLFRPGPYACAEWDFGGYPYWLLNEKNMTIRANDPKFMELSKAYLSALAKQTLSLQVTKGGPILMVQVENEYGSYGKDKKFMTSCRDMLKEVGYDVPLYVAEGGNQLANAYVSGTVAGVNGGAWTNTKEFADKYTPGGPYFVPEFYPGWLDHWDEPKSKTDGGVAEFKDLIANGASVGLYMFHGGTNFGFMAGANYGDNYQPDLTSYDYDAPLDELGRPREKYFGFRKVIEDQFGRSLPKVPESPKVVTVPEFELKPRGGIAELGTRSKRFIDAPTMESLDQDYGYVLYKTTIAKGGKFELGDVRDYAVVSLNGKPVGTIDRHLKQTSIELKEGGELELLIENCGRINYGHRLTNNNKGLIKNPTLNGEEVKNWSVTSLPLAKPPKLTGQGAVDGPTFYEGTFEVSSVGEVLLDMSNWGKGIVWVNGHHLGRYWSIGPQQTLYLPSCWLKKGVNKVVVFEQLKTSKPVIAGVSSPVLDQLIKH